VSARRTSGKLAAATILALIADRRLFCCRPE
jgi:hypothetical protein